MRISSQLFKSVERGLLVEKAAEKLKSGDGWPSSLTTGGLGLSWWWPAGVDKVKGHRSDPQTWLVENAIPWDWHLNSGHLTQMCGRKGSQVEETWVPGGNERHSRRTIWRVVHLGLGDSLMRGVLGPVGCRAASLVSTRQVPGAPPPQCDNQKCFQILRSVYWGLNCPWLQTTAIDRKLHDG